jgi:hypothetical protein
MYHLVIPGVYTPTEGFVGMPDPDLEKLVDAAEAPGAALAARFEDEVVPPPLDL